MKTNELEIKKLIAEGFKEVYVWKDKPNEIYKEHSHPYDTKLIIVGGEISLNLENKNVRLKAGDAVLIKKNKLHSAKVGDRGCEYIVGEAK